MNCQTDFVNQGKCIQITQELHPGFTLIYVQCYLLFLFAFVAGYRPSWFVTLRFVLLYSYHCYIISSDRSSRVLNIKSILG